MSVIIDAGTTPSAFRTVFNRLYDIMRLIEFDVAKNAHGVGLERFADMDLETAISVEDTRKEYGERRVRFFGGVASRPRDRSADAGKRPHELGHARDENR